MAQTPLLPLHDEHGDAPLPLIDLSLTAPVTSRTTSVKGGWVNRNGPSDHKKPRMPVGPAKKARTG